MLNRRSMYGRSSRTRKLGFESLEERRVFAVAPVEPPYFVAPVLASDPQHLELHSLEVVDGDVSTLPVARFAELTPEQVPLLTTAQVASIGIYLFGTQWTPAHRAALTQVQVPALQVDVTRITAMVNGQRIAALTPTQMSWLTESQIQRVVTDDFFVLPTDKIPLLTTSQIESVEIFLFGTQWNAAQRGALTQAQVPALQVDKTRITALADGLRIAGLTPTQMSWLTASQIQKVILEDFYVLPPDQIQSLSPAQIANVGVYQFGTQWSPAQRAALSQDQVSALQVDVTRITALVNGQRVAALTPTQLSWLTVSQIQKVILDDLYVLPIEQIPSLSLSQIASVGVYLFGTQWSPAQRVALTQVQVSALQVDVTRITALVNGQRVAALTPTQMSWLTASQIQKVILDDFYVLPTEQIPSLSLSQIASVGVYLFGAQWSAAQRAALTQEQVRALQVADTRISIQDPLNPNDPDKRVAALTPTQISWLTVAQINSLMTTDLSHLLPEQIPLIAPAQFNAMSNLAVINGFSDAVRAALTQDQLLALPFNLLSQYMSVEPVAFPPASYHSPMNDPVTGLVGGAEPSNNPHSMARQAFALAVYENAAFKNIASGDWSDPAIWENGLVPSAGATVGIKAGTTVRFDIEMSHAIKTLRINGALTFATDLNTTLRVDTIVVDTFGRLHVGTAAAPIGENVVARIVIPDGGPIDRAWDPYLVSRGLLSRGEVRMHGREVTSFATLAVDPLAQATTLQLTAAPVGWRVGDELVIAGANPILADFGSERVRIAAIDGATISLDRELTYSHDAPDGFGFSIQVANLNRNIQFMAEDPSVALERPHIAFFENPNVRVENVLINGFGRTDKARPINDSVVVNGVLQPGTGTNPRARYALHFHHAGINPAVASAIVRGNVVVGSPGWGYVNHESNVAMEQNVAVDVVGAAFVTEDGNEIGIMKGNLAMNAKGSGGRVLDRIGIHDWGHGGHGFWLQGPGVALIDNIVSGSNGGAFAYATSSAMAMFDKVNLIDSSLATMGREAVPVGVPPLRTFKGNVAYAVDQGLEIWFHQTNLNSGETVIEDFTAWNMKRLGIQLPYSGRITIVDAVLINRFSAAAGHGVLTNRLTQSIRLSNIRIEGFENGIVVPMRRSTIIEGGRLSNVKNILISKGHDTLRSLEVTSPIAFIPLSASQINGRPTFDVSVNQAMAIPDHLNRNSDSLFSADNLTMIMSDGRKLRLYFADQASAAVPFPTAPSPPIEGFRPEFIGLTNLQLQQRYDVWFNGGDLPTSAYTPAGFIGFAVAEIPTLSADFDADGDVDGADFLSWQRGFGIPMPLAQKRDGDADDDQDVDAADLSSWARGFGAQGAPTLGAEASTDSISALRADSGTEFTASNVALSDQSLVRATVLQAGVAQEQFSPMPRKASKWRRLQFWYF